MIPSHIIQIAKSVAICDYLAYRQVQPVRQSGQRLFYLSPFRSETTPSFCVNQSINRYKDFGTSEAGDDIIRLVERLEQCSFSTAVETLQQFAGQPVKPSFTFSGLSSYSPTSSGSIRAVKLLENPALVRYVEQRQITYPNARKYLREVYYTQKDINLFAIGFENDKGGYALRNQWTDKTGNVRQTKRNIGPTWYTTIRGNESFAVNVFEGIFDFLSALEFYSLNTPNCTTLVLNSTSNLQAALPELRQYKRINAYFDHDKAGQSALNALRSERLPVADRSAIYAGSNDFNDYWKNRPP